MFCGRPVRGAVSYTHLDVYKRQGYENEGAYLFIGDTYDKKYDKVKEKKVNAIERYRMLPVRAVMDK